MNFHNEEAAAAGWGWAIEMSLTSYDLSFQMAIDKRDVLIISQNFLMSCFPVLLLEDSVLLLICFYELESEELLSEVEDLERSK